jgi:transposase
MKRDRSYPSDVTDEEWAFVAPYLALCREDSEQREYPLRAVFNALRYIVRTGGQWRYMPNYLPPWTVVYQQTQRWIRARCFETMVEDLLMLLREFAGRKAAPTAMILDSRTLQSTPESGARAGYDGAKRRKGSKVHAAVDTLGYLLALHVTPADEQDRAQVGELARQVQQITEENVELAYAFARGNTRDGKLTKHIEAPRCRYPDVSLAILKYLAYNVTCGSRSTCIRSVQNMRWKTSANGPLQHLFTKATIPCVSMHSLKSNNGAARDGLAIRRLTDRFNAAFPTRQGIAEDHAPGRPLFGTAPRQFWPRLTKGFEKSNGPNLSCLITSRMRDSELQATRHDYAAKKKCYTIRRAN